MSNPRSLKPETNALATTFLPYLDAVDGTLNAVGIFPGGHSYVMYIPGGDTVILGLCQADATRVLAALADKHAQREADRKPMGRPPTARATEGVHPIFCELALDLHETFTALRTSRSLTLRAAVEEALRLWVSTQSHPP